MSGRLPTKCSEWSRTATFSTRRCGTTGRVTTGVPTPRRIELWFPVAAGNLGGKRGPDEPVSVVSARPCGREAVPYFGPQPRDHSFRLNGKVQRGALRSALSLRADEGALVLVTGFPLESPSTKKFRAQLDELKFTKRVLIVDVKPSRELVLSARNLPGVEVRSVAALHTYDVLAARHIALSEEAAARLEEKLGR